MFASDAGAVYSVIPFAGKLAASINSRVQIFNLSAASGGSGGGSSAAAAAAAPSALPKQLVPEVRALIWLLVVVCAD